MNESSPGRSSATTQRTPTPFGSWRQISDVRRATAAAAPADDRGVLADGGVVEGLAVALRHRRAKGRGGIERERGAHHSRTMATARRRGVARAFRGVSLPTFCSWRIHCELRAPTSVAIQPASLASLALALSSRPLPSRSRRSRRLSLVVVARGRERSSRSARAFRSRAATRSSPPSRRPRSRKGMKGYGLTVFKGTQPERFDVEVIGVLHHFRPGQELIVIKTPNPRLDVVKTVQGHEREPHLPRWAARGRVRVQPLGLRGRAGRGRHAHRPHAHRDATADSRRASGPRAAALRCPGARRSPAPRSAGEPARRSTRSTARPAPTTSTSTRASSPSALGHGTGARARHGPRGDAAHDVRRGRSRPRGAAQARRAARPRAPAGRRRQRRTIPAAPAALRQRRRARRAARRAATSRSWASAPRRTSTAAGKVAGFGHPMLNGGDEALPACIGRVLWINASAQASHKVGECARPLGTLVQDRQSAIVVDERIVAPVIPIDVDIAGVVGAPKPHWHAELTDDKFLGAGPGGDRDRVGHRGDDERAARPHVEDDVARDGRGARRGRPRGRRHRQRRHARRARLVRSKLVTTVGDVLNNPWEHARIDGVQARFEVKYARDLWRLRGVEVLDPVVDAGDKVATASAPRPRGRARGHARRRDDDARRARRQGRRCRGRARLRRRAGAAGAREPRPAARERAAADGRRARRRRPVPRAVAGHRVPRARHAASAARSRSTRCARRAATPGPTRSRAGRAPSCRSSSTSRAATR